MSKPGRRTLTDDAKQAKAAFKLPSLELGMPSLPNPFGGGAKGPSAAQVKVCVLGMCFSVCFNAEKRQTIKHLYS